MASDIFRKYATRWNDQQLGFGKESYSDLTSSFESAMAAQATQFAKQRRKQEERMQQFQQQMIEAQTRQAAPEQTAQVLGIGKASGIRRAGASTRLSRPELQIKSMNI